MEIIVQGKGTEYFTSDEAILNINFYIKGQSYEEVLTEGVKNVEIFVNEVLLRNVFNKDEMKTRSYIIREDRKYNEIKK